MRLMWLWVAGIVFSVTTLVNAQKLRSFSLIDLNNNVEIYDDIKSENLTVIDFWASWCKPCIKAMPYLQEKSDKLKEKGVVVLGINVDGPRSISKVKPLCTSLGIEYPVLYDTNNDVMKDLQVNALPTILIVDKDNKIVWRKEGYAQGDGDKMIDWINNYLSK